MSAPQPPFPSRPYTTALHNRPSTFQTPFSTAQNPNPAGSTAASNAAAPNLPQTTQQKETMRFERERAERADRERREAENRSAFEALSEEQREEVNEAFALFDLDKDEYVDYHEFKVALKALGFEVPKGEILGLLQTYGVPASSLQQGGKQAAIQQQQQAPTFSGPSRLLLSHAHFLAIAAQRILARDPREEILRAFDLFDADGKGRIELEDLRRVARELGEGLQEEELAAMIEEFDVRGEGGISREEFVGICLG